MSSSSQSPSSSSLLFLVLAAVLFFPPLLANAASRPLLCSSDPDGCTNRVSQRVGGRKELEGVEHNEELQALGRFAVVEHNRRLSLSSDEQSLLGFRRVERAQSQVVAGIKYYLTVSVAGGTGRYNAEIVVRSWENSWKLLSFTPVADDAVTGGGGCGGSFPQEG